MRVLVLLSLFLTLVHGKEQRALLGKPLSAKAERLLKKEHNARRQTKKAIVAVPEKRRLSDVTKVRKLPYSKCIVF
jgi:hypothetical protein